jgi:hypothetical protein
MEFGLLESFPHLWKNLLKMRVWRAFVRYGAMFHDTFSRRKSVKHGLTALFWGHAELSDALWGAAEAKVRKSP